MGQAVAEMSPKKRFRLNVFYCIVGVALALFGAYLFYANVGEVENLEASAPGFALKAGKTGAGVFFILLGAFAIWLGRPPRLKKTSKKIVREVRDPPGDDFNDIEIIEHREWD